MKYSLIIIFGAMIGAANAQTVYYCNKAGKKIITDQPCDKHGAAQTKSVTSQEMPPLNVSQGLSQKEKQKGQAVTERLKREDSQFQQEREQQKARDQEQRRNNERVCAQLWRYKERIIAQQRAMNSEYWNSEHRRVNDEIYRRECGN